MVDLPLDDSAKSKQSARPARPEIGRIYRINVSA